MSKTRKKLERAYPDSLAPAIATDDFSDPVYAQYVRDAREDHITPEERTDPIGDDPHSPVQGIVHRHPDRALLKITDICAAYCRFCFRKDMVGQGDGILDEAELKVALSYIQNAPHIREIILTGGDPLTLSNRRLKDVLEKLYAIEHLDIIRFHTRTPLIKPARIDEELCGVLKDCPKALYVVLHVNHTQELTDEVKKAIRTLDQSGAVLLSQSVLLRGVNDDTQTLEDLFRALVRLKVKPYYLHHLDRAQGTSHFEVSPRIGQEIIARLRGRISGLCLPTYILDIPGGFGKMPLEQCTLEDEQDHYTIQDPHGRRHIYPKGQSA